MGILVSIIGAVLVLVGLWDMFHSLLHPRGKGALSHPIQKSVWALSRPHAGVRLLPSEHGRRRENLGASLK